MKIFSSLFINREFYSVLSEWPNTGAVHGYEREREREEKNEIGRG